MKDRLHSGRCSQFLKALADSERLKIVQCLQSGPKAVNEISRELGAPLANVSHHLGLLRGAGLVSTEKRGRFVIYSLQSKLLRDQGQVLDFGCCRIELGKGRNRT